MNFEHVQSLLKIAFEEYGGEKYDLVREMNDLYHKSLHHVPDEILFQTAGAEEESRKSNPTSVEVSLRRVPDEHSAADEYEKITKYLNADAYFASFPVTTTPYYSNLGQMPSNTPHNELIAKAIKKGVQVILKTKGGTTWYLKYPKNGYSDNIYDYNVLEEKFTTNERKQTHKGYEAWLIKY